jgi:hypothetical protein
MKHACFACLFLCLTATFLLSQSNPVPSPNQTASVVAPISASQVDPKAQAKILDQYGKLPLSFEANHGQTDGRVRFLSRTSGYTLFLTGDEAVLALSGKTENIRKAEIAGTAHTLQSSMAATKAGGVLRMRLRNANPAAKVTGVDGLAGTSNYFIGNDPAKWRTKVPTYAKVKYEGIYSGIDLVYYGNQRQLEYDFIVAAGADPHRIQFDVLGAKRIHRDGKGELVFKVGEDEIRWHKPLVYQEKNGARQEIAAHYAITDANRVSFEVAKYDAGSPLYIDPLVYSTYLGGSGVDAGIGVAVDSSGNAYVTGYTQSTDFPVTPGAFQTTCNGGNNCANYGDAFVAKLNPTGSALVYSTYLGGSSSDWAGGIAVDSSGNAYVTGYTASTDFPITPGAFQTVCGGACLGNVFVTKLNPTGSALIYSTYLGGSRYDNGTGIAVDSADNAYVIGATCSTDFPTMNPFQPAYGGGDCSIYGYGDAFVSKINATGSALVYSTYLGGSGYDTGTGIAVDSSGNAYVTGSTGSTDFPTMNPLQPSYGGGSYDAFVSKINATGSALVYSTYLGGNGFDQGDGIAVDSSGNAYVTGSTGSTNFPTMNPLQPSYGGGSYDAFVSKINATGSALVYSTYLGGSGFDQGNGIAVDSSGNAYVAGSTQSTDFPTVNPLQPKFGGVNDVFVTKINPTGSSLVYSTYLGGSGLDVGTGIVVDSSGNAYVTGSTGSTNFPTINPLQPANAGGGDTFVAKISQVVTKATTTTTLLSSVNPSVSGKPVTFTATVSSSSGGTPTGKVQFLNGTAVLATVRLTSGSAKYTTLKLPPGSNIMSAVYEGDSKNNGSTSAPVDQFVLAATTTTLKSSANPSVYGQTVVFTAKVTSSVGAPPDGETVTFKQGATVLGTGTLSGGTATFSVSTLAVGTKVITAVYSGDSNLAGSTSKDVNQVISKATTTTTLTSSLNPSKVGQTVTFTATVLSEFSGTPTGSVVFKDGTKTLKTVTLSGGVASYTTSTLTHGTHSITATYNGSTSFIGSSASLIQTVN